MPLWWRLISTKRMTEGNIHRQNTTDISRSLHQLNHHQLIYNHNIDRLWKLEVRIGSDHLFLWYNIYSLLVQHLFNVWYSYTLIGATFNLWSVKHLFSNWQSYTLVKHLFSDWYSYPLIGTTFIIWLVRHLCSDWYNIYSLIGTAIFWLVQYLFLDWYNIYSLISTAFTLWLLQHLFPDWYNIYSLIVTTLYLYSSSAKTGFRNRQWWWLIHMRFSLSNNSRERLWKEYLQKNPQR